MSDEELMDKYMMQDRKIELMKLKTHPLESNQSPSAVWLTMGQGTVVTWIRLTEVLCHNAGFKPLNTIKKTMQRTAVLQAHEVPLGKITGYLQFEICYC